MLIPAAVFPMMVARPVRATVSVAYGSLRAPVASRTVLREVSRSRPRPAAPVFVGRDGRHITVARIRAYLARHGSPMAAHAEAIVRAGIRYGFDPRTTVAVAGVETSWGVMTRHHNAWGWAPGSVRWSSWNQSIWSWTRAASASYRSLRRGDFYVAGPRYNPTTTWRHWAAQATAIFRAI